MARPNPTQPHTPAAGRWPLWAEIVVSLLLVFHLGVVMTFPFTVGNDQVPTASVLARSVFEVPVMRHYVEVAYLNHGYKFFAPNPGTQSRQIRYVLEFADGTSQEGVFPDRDKHWPRLLYHRHFMLTEHLTEVLLPPSQVAPYLREGLGDEPSAADEVPPSGLAPLVPQMLASYGGQLVKQHGADRVTLYERIHVVPRLVDVREGLTLDDPRLYQDRELGTVTADGQVSWPGQQDRGEVQ